MVKSPEHLSFVLIDGAGACGKAILRGYLDGHPNMFVLPVHDMIVDTLCRCHEEIWLQCKDGLILRDRLSDSYYYLLEHYAAKGYMEYDTSCKERGTADINLDFHSFERQWRKALHHLDAWSPESIASCIGNSLVAHWKDYHSPTHSVCHFVSMGAGKIETLEYFHKAFPKGKLLWMQREIEDLVATLANRRPVDDDSRSLHLNEVTVKSLVENGYVSHVSKCLTKARLAQMRFPDVYKVVQFEELIANPESVIREVQLFLGLNYDSSLKSCSVLGKPLMLSNGRSAVAEVLDRAVDLLARKELVPLRVAIGTKSIFYVVREPLLTLIGVWWRCCVLLKQLGGRISRFTLRWRREGGRDRFF